MRCSPTQRPRAANTAKGGQNKLSGNGDLTTVAFLESETLPLRREERLSLASCNLAYLPKLLVDVVEEVTFRVDVMKGL